MYMYIRCMAHSVLYRWTVRHGCCHIAYLSLQSVVSEDEPRRYALDLPAPVPLGGHRGATPLLRQMGVVVRGEELELVGAGGWEIRVRVSLRYLQILQ